MRNFIRFLTKNAFLFLFLFLELTSIVLLIKNNNYQHSKFLNSSNFLVGNLYESITNITNYLHLKSENEILRTQNAKLLSENKNSFIKIFGNTVQINDTSYFQKYIYTAAKVINNSTNQRENYITLDKGSINGIKAGMGVINSTGVVGIVKNVSANFSSVISLLHQKNSISGKIKSSNYYGSVVWDSDKNAYNTAFLKEIPNHVKLNIGDTILTSGFSSIFPEGILLGTIKSYNLEKGANFYDIEINLSVDFKKIVHVYIIKSLLKEEQTALEKSAQENVN